MAIGRQVSTLLLAATGLLPVGKALDRATIAISPKIALAPLSDLRIRARIPVDAHNVGFCVTAFLDDAAMRRSCEQLDGLDSAITHEFFWHNFREPGTYLIALDVMDDAGHRTRTDDTLEIKGSTDGR